MGIVLLSPYFAEDEIRTHVSKGSPLGFRPLSYSRILPFEIWEYNDVLCINKDNNYYRLSIYSIIMIYIKKSSPF